MIMTVQELRRHVDTDKDDQALEDMRAFFEGVSRDLMRTPDFIPQAFLQSVTTFALD